jgi:hypothetical protein
MIQILEPTKIPTAAIINIGIKYWPRSFSIICTKPNHKYGFLLIFAKTPCRAREMFYF